ncbi:hypothetical protein Zmor_006807 [Zophobas morio]|uniref:Uncharacterized protein n=1 Tax=Zophobas morio TaxID=2755281 RepID=A0AA38J0M2_9CUCU|nr:hypothetical protein Zmor_006807 [Zophobas morio]
MCICSVTQTWKLQRRRKMADSNIRLLEIENEFLREIISKHQLQFDLMTRREDKVKNTIDALQQQRNQCTEDYKCLSATTKDKIHQLEDKIKKYKAQIQDYDNKFEENRLQHTVVQKELINTQAKLINIHEMLDNKHEEMHSIHRQLIFQHEELAKCNAALFEKSVEVCDLRNKLDKNEEKYKNLLLLNQMALVRVD